MKKKSMKLNALLYSIQKIMSIIFPLITFPYSSRVLGVTEIGKYNFSQSVVSYFVLLAGLGIGTYAVREGARIRDDKKCFVKFATDIFSINLYSTILSYVVLGILIIVISKFQEYAALIAVLSLQMIFTTIGRDWLYVIYEDYLFITIRQTLFQALSVVLLFVLVRDQSGVFLYCVTSVSGIIGGSILNFFLSRKYAPIKFNWKPELKHLIPILLIFSTNISVIIYASSDTTMLGFFGTNDNVGLYGTSVKIYNIVKHLLAAVLTVTIPRFSYYLGNNDKKAYNRLFNKVLNVLILMVFPAVTGLIFMGRECIYILAGQEYIEAAETLQILSLALIFNLVSYMYGYCVLIPNRKEKAFFLATLISAAVNITLNFILIPFFMEKAAAFTTVVAEIVVATLCIIFSKKLVHVKGIKKNLVCVTIGCVWIILLCLFIKSMHFNEIITVCIVLPGAVIGYILIQLLFRNQTMTDLTKGIASKLKKGKSTKQKQKSIENDE